MPDVHDNTLSMKVVSDGMDELCSGDGRNHSKN